MDGWMNGCIKGCDGQWCLSKTEHHYETLVRGSNIDIFLTQCKALFYFTCSFRLFSTTSGFEEKSAYNNFFGDLVNPATRVSHHVRSDLLLSCDVI